MDVALRLSDGPQMMAADVGDPDGFPVLYVAGYGHCRLARHPDDGLAAGAGVRLLAVDLPGLGGSDPRPGYSLLTWARDGIELAGQLGIGRFAVLGWSWGGPYALALARQYPDRVAGVGLVSALGGWLAGPGHTAQACKEYRNFAWLCRLAPPLVKMFLARQRRAVLADPKAAQARDLAAARPPIRPPRSCPGSPPCWPPAGLRRGGRHRWDVRSQPRRHLALGLYPGRGGGAGQHLARHRGPGDLPRHGRIPRPGDAARQLDHPARRGAPAAVHALGRYLAPARRPAGRHPGIPIARPPSTRGSRTEQRTGKRW
jgi:pimeloyl-ACP methyl ester carboxylesterase